MNIAGISSGHTTGIRFAPRTLAAAGFGLLVSFGAGEPLAAQARDTVWTIPSGRFADVRVPIDRRRAADGGRSRRFWRSAPGTARLVTWSPARFPLRVAFRHENGNRVSDADSTEFWKALAQMEDDFGMDLFIPASLERGADPSDVIVVEVKPIGANNGLTLISWSSSGEVWDARVFFRNPTALRDASVVTHEMMHALGFGHTMAWQSVVNPFAGPDRLTAEDVAYAQLAMRERLGHDRSDVWERLALAIEREGGLTGKIAPPSADCLDYGRSVPETGMIAESRALPPFTPARGGSSCGAGDAAMK